MLIVAVYQEGEYDSVLARIKEKIDTLCIEMGETLSEAAIVDFEKQCGIRLPSAYRAFLKAVGDGCEQMLDGFALRRLADIPRRNLALPFGLEEAWIWEDEEAVEEALIADRVYQGEIELIDIGCGMTYHLIVCGKCRGEVWCFTDVGVQPCAERQDFLGWFELWLDEQEETDYFQ